MNSPISYPRTMASVPGILTPPAFVLSRKRSSRCPLGGSTGQWTGSSWQPASLSAAATNDSRLEKVSYFCLTTLPACPDSSTASIFYLFSSHAQAMQSDSRSIRLILTLEVFYFSCILVKDVLKFQILHLQLLLCSKMPKKTYRTYFHSCRIVSAETENSN